MNRVAPPPAGALICDLDGTLIDSVPDLAAAMDDLLAEAGRAPLPVAAVRTMVGDGVKTLVERAMAASGGAPTTAELAVLVSRYLAYYDQRLTALTRPYPGAVATLTALKAAGWRLAVCSNKPERPSRRIVAALGFDGLFEAIAGGDTFAVKKPDPAHLHGVLRAMGVAAAVAVMLGDSRNDVLAARGAGLPVIIMAHGYGQVPAHELGADAVVETFAELPGALAAVSAGR